MRISSIAMMAIALPLAAAAGRTDIGPATNPLVCGETATNAAVCVAAGVDANRFRLSIELDAATNGCVMVELGVDADENGVLDPGEAEFAVGWDCGCWIYRDFAGGACETAVASPGRRRIEWCVALGDDGAARSLVAVDGRTKVFSGPVASTFHSGDWNIVRVVRRGPSAGECVVVDTFSAPLYLFLR